MTVFSVPELKIVIISNHSIVCLGLQKVFESRETPRFHVHSYPRMMPEVLLPEHCPDLIILDMETERGVIDAIKQTRETDQKIKIMLLSGFEDKTCMREALEYGVDGVILKVQPPQVVLAAIGALFSPVRSNGFDSRDRRGFGDSMKSFKPSADGESPAAIWPDALTEREREVIGLVRQGLSNKDIAHRLSISDSTVRHHLTSIFDKVGVPNRQKLLVHAHHTWSPLE